MRLKPRGDQTEQKWIQNAPQGPPERLQRRTLVPAGSPRSSQNEPKISLLKVQGHRCDTKGPQELSRYPPRLKIEPKWNQE